MQPTHSGRPLGPGAASSSLAEGDAPAALPQAKREKAGLGTLAGRTVVSGAAGGPPGAGRKALPPDPTASDLQLAAGIHARHAQAILARLTAPADGKAAASSAQGHAGVAHGCARLMAAGMPLEQAWDEAVRVAALLKAGEAPSGGIGTLVQLSRIGVPTAQLQQYQEWMAWVHDQLTPPSGRPLLPFEAWRAVEDAAKALLVDARGDPAGLQAVAQAILGGASKDEAMAAYWASAVARRPPDPDAPVRAHLRDAGVPEAGAKELLALMKAAAGPGGRLDEGPWLERALMTHRLSSPPRSGDLADLFALAGHAQALAGKPGMDAAQAERLAATAHQYAQEVLAGAHEIISLPDTQPPMGTHPLLPVSLGLLASKLPSYEIHDQADMTPTARRSWQRLTECIALFIQQQPEAVRMALPLGVRASLFCACSDKISRAHQKKSAQLLAMQAQAPGSASGRRKDILPKLVDAARLAMLGQLFDVKDFETASSTGARSRFEARVRPRIAQIGLTWESMSDAQCQSLLREVFREHQAAFGYGETSLRFSGASADVEAASAAAQAQGDPGPAPGTDPRELQMGYYHPQTQTVSVQLWDAAPASPGGRVRRPLSLVFDTVVHELTHRHQHELAFRYLDGQIGPTDDGFHLARIMAAATFTNPVESMLRARGVTDDVLLDQAYRFAPAEQDAYAAGGGAAQKLQSWLQEASGSPPSLAS